MDFSAIELQAQHTCLNQESLVKWNIQVRLVVLIHHPHFFILTPESYRNLIFFLIPYNIP